MLNSIMSLGFFLPRHVLELIVSKMWKKLETDNFDRDIWNLKRGILICSSGRSIIEHSVINILQNQMMETSRQVISDFLNLYSKPFYCSLWEKFVLLACGLDDQRFLSIDNSASLINCVNWGRVELAEDGYKICDLVFEVVPWIFSSRQNKQSLGWYFGTFQTISVLKGILVRFPTHHWTEVARLANEIEYMPWWLLGNFQAKVLKIGTYFLPTPRSIFSWRKMYWPHT